MTQIHLPEDIGDSQSKAGQKPIAQSYPFVLASDELVAYAGVFSPTNEAEKLNPIYKPASENVTDVFALSRQVKSSVLFRDVSNYDFAPNQWSFQIADTTGGDSLLPGAQSIIWTERINTRASYPGSITEVKFLPQSSAIQLRNYPADINIGYQQTVLYSNRVFSASVNPIFVTVAVSMTLSDNPGCSKTWGLFSSNSGYFFRIYGNGAANTFVVGYRSSVESVAAEVEIPRSQFNGDKLDGTNGGHTQTFTNIGMFGIEIGTAGIGARFWAYVTTGNTARWVLVHSLFNDSDSSQSRITDEEALPISFEIKNAGQSSVLQTLSKYGTSVTSIGQPIGTSDINSISSSKLISPSRSPFPIIGIRASDSMANKRNSNNTLISKLNLSLSQGTWRIVLIKNPATNPLTNWLKINNFSAIQYNTNRDFPISGGTQIAQFSISQNKPLSISLKDIFALNRQFLTAQYTNDTQPSGDFGQQFLLESDEIWICAIDANIPYTNNEIIWDASNTFNSSATYEFANSSSLSNLAATIHASINTLEV